MSENGGTNTVIDGRSFDNTMSFDVDLLKLETELSISDTEETIANIQNYLDSFEREIERNNVTKVQADGNSVAPAYSMDQNVQYYYQTSGDGHVVTVDEHPGHDLQMMDNKNQNHTDNLTQVALPNIQNKIEKDIPQIVALGDGNGYQTVTLIKSETDANNYVHYGVKQNNKNEEISNFSIEVSRDHDSGVKKEYDFNDERKPTLPKQQKIKDLKKEDDKTKLLKLASKESLTVTPKIHKCDYCNYSSGKKRLLTSHKKTHSKERPHQCNFCERNFKTTTSFQNHINTHTGTKPYHCQSCSSVFTTSGELIRHVKYKHTHEKPHKCSICEYASVELSKMRNHMKIHTGDRPYPCPQCPYSSTDAVKLKRHLRTHSGEKPFECDICFAKFTQSNSLKTHKLIHSGGRPIFKCDHCPLTCNRKPDLRKHVQNLHTSDKPILCNRCGDAFPDRYQLKVHRRSHKGEKCFKCELCSYASTTRRLLNSHMLKHSDEKPFQCDKCNQAYKQKQLLRRHHNLHHNPKYVPPQPQDKPYHCNTCAQTFRHKGNLIRHMEIHVRRSTENDRNTALKQRLEYIDSANEGEYEEDTSIQPSGIGAVSVKSEDGQQYVLLEAIHLGGRDQMDCTSTNVSIKQEPSSPSKKDVIILPVSVSDVKEEWDEDEKFLGFDDESDEETTNASG